MNLITDRTAADTQRKKELAAKGYANMTTAEKTEWNAGLKGAYKYSDLNRVGQACADMYAALTEAGYAVPGYTALPINWARGDRPTPADLQTYLATVAAIKAALPTATPIPSTMRRITVEDANNIEKMLLEVEDILNRIARTYVRSGVYHSGAVIYVAEAI